MSYARTALLCACALAVNAVAHAAPALPARSVNTGSKMVQEESIVIRRLPDAYFYPFSLWPLPKYKLKMEEELRKGKINNVVERQNER